MEKKIKAFAWHTKVIYHHFQQPPSDTGYSALPPIMEPCIRCVTQETQTSLQQDEKNVPMLLAELENVRAENKNMQKQIDHLKHTHSQVCLSVLR